MRWKAAEWNGRLPTSAQADRSTIHCNRGLRVRAAERERRASEVLLWGVQRNRWLQRARPRRRNVQPAAALWRCRAHMLNAARCRERDPSHHVLHAHAAPATEGIKPATRGARPATRGTRPATRGTQPVTRGAQRAVTFTTRMHTASAAALPGEMSRGGAVWLHRHGCLWLQVGCPPSLALISTTRLQAGLKAVAGLACTVASWFEYGCRLDHLQRRDDSVTPAGAKREHRRCHCERDRRRWECAAPLERLLRPPRRAEAALRGE